jgi:hypothetical protein
MKLTTVNVQGADHLLDPLTYGLRRVKKSKQRITTILSFIVNSHPHQQGVAVSELDHWICTELIYIAIALQVSHNLNPIINQLSTLKVEVRGLTFNKQAITS